MLINFKRFLLDEIESFIKKGYFFSHIDEMNISTDNDTMYMTYEKHIKRPVEAIELKLNMIIAKNPHLINSLNRSHNHPSIRKYSHIPFNICQ